MLSTTFDNTRTHNLQRLENILNKNAELAQEIKDICGSLKPMEFESYFDYFLINGFRRGRSESGHVDMIDLRRHEHARYYQRLNNNNNKNNNKVKNHNSQNLNTTITLDGDKKNIDDSNENNTINNATLITNNIGSNLTNKAPTSKDSSTSQVTKVDLGSSPPLVGDSNNNDTNNESNNNASLPLNGSSLLEKTTSNNSTTTLDNMVKPPLENDFNNNDNDNDLEETFDPQTDQMMSSPIKNEITNELNKDGDNDIYTNDAFDNLESSSLVAKLIEPKGPTEEINGNITKDSIIETTLMNEMEYSEHYRRRSARISKKAEAKKLHKQTSKSNKLNFQLSQDTNGDVTNDGDTSDGDNSSDLNKYSTKNINTETYNNNANGNSTDDNEPIILDLYESLVIKSAYPIRRSDWVLPPRLRYTPEKQLRTRAVFTSIKINELIGSSQITKILSRFEGGVQGIRSSNRSTLQ